MIQGHLIDRPNRFVMNVRVPEQGIVKAYCPNTSRLIGLLEGNPAVLMTTNSDTERSTDYTVRCVRDNGVWVGIEAAKANEWFERYLLDPDRTHFKQWDDWEREVKLSGSQIDFMYSYSDSHDHWVEVKSLSSRSPDGTAFYSGTPSRRAYRHINHLSETVGNGNEADIVFVIQRPDVEGVSPGDETEEEWVSHLREANQRGVGIKAFRCKRSGNQWCLDDRIPAEL